MLKIICVCLGNICRSPVAEALSREKLVEEGYQEGVDFELDSAGTGDWHLGYAPDPRAQQICESHGIDVSNMKARKFTTKDGKKYDFIFGMDKNNLDDMTMIVDPDHVRKLQLFDTHEVNDPYYGILDGFEIMYQQLERAAERWIEMWQDQLGG